MVLIVAHVKLKRFRQQHVTYVHAPRCMRTLAQALKASGLLRVHRRWVAAITMLMFNDVSRVFHMHNQSQLSAHHLTKCHELLITHAFKLEALRLDHQMLLYKQIMGHGKTQRLFW
jgi:hypothetical protein